MDQPLRKLFLLAVIFCCFGVHETAGAAGTVNANGSGKSIKKQIAREVEASKVGASKSKLIASNPPALSSSKRWRTTSTAGGNEYDEIIPKSGEPAPKSEVLDPPEFLPGAASNIPFALDLLAQKDPRYLSYLKSKPVPKSSSRAAAAPSSPISRKLARFDAGQLERCLRLRDCSMWEAVRIIEEPAFDGLQLDYFSELPLVYMKRRVMEPFKAFLRRFKYRNESKHAGGMKEAAGYTAPFTVLVLKFLDPVHLTDILLDPFFKFIVESQRDAFEPLEQFFMDFWLRSGPAAWRFIKHYFEFSRSRTKTGALVKVLADKNYSGPLTRDLITYLLTIESFDINARILCRFSGDMQLTSFFHILVLESRFSSVFLPIVLRDRRLDVNVPTGKIILASKAFEMTYTDVQIVSLAAILCNFWAVFHLCLNDKIFKNIRSDKFIIFVFCHIFRVLWLSLVYRVRHYYEMIYEMILKSAAEKAS